MFILKRVHYSVLNDLLTFLRFIYEESVIDMHVQYVCVQAHLLDLLPKFYPQLFTVLLYTTFNLFIKVYSLTKEGEVAWLIEERIN